MQLSIHFSVEEFERSQTATRLNLKNKMNATQTENAKQLCEHALELIRNYYKSPVVLSSGFRSTTVNARIGSVGTSDHCKGMAADFTVIGKSIQQVFDDIRNGKIEGLTWRQLIHEGTWVHLAYNKNDNKKQVMIAHFGKSGTRYTVL